jgi:hypothetical protein
MRCTTYPRSTPQPITAWTVDLSSSGIKPTSRIGLSVVDRAPGRRSKLGPRASDIEVCRFSSLGIGPIMTAGVDDQNG